MAKKKQSKKKLSGAGPWPPSLAAKIISGYIAREYDIDAITIRRYNPPMGSMPFFDNDAPPAIRKGELVLVAGALLKFLTGLGIPYEDDDREDDDEIMTDLIEAMVDAEAPSSGMVEVIDTYYRFRDEV